MKCYSTAPPGEIEFKIELTDERLWGDPPFIPKVPRRGYQVGGMIVARVPTLDRCAADWAAYKPHWGWQSVYDHNGVERSSYWHGTKRSAAMQAERIPE